MQVIFHPILFLSCSSCQRTGPPSCQRAFNFILNLFCWLRVNHNIRSRTLFIKQNFLILNSSPKWSQRMLTRKPLWAFLFQIFQNQGQTFCIPKNIQIQIELLIDKRRFATITFTYFHDPIVVYKLLIDNSLKDPGDLLKNFWDPWRSLKNIAVL